MSIPLHQINAFDAAARHLSFSRAAEELNVLQPAISRHVAALEAELGTRLFARTKPRLTLTEDGVLLAKAVSQGFGAIRGGLDAVRTRAHEDTIVVSASIGFTSLYLLPRLAGFQADHPDTKLQIVTRDQNPDYDPAKCDVVILFGEHGIPGCPSLQIFPERMVAICRPDLLHDGQPYSRAALAGQKLLHMSERDHNGDWGRYFQGTGKKVPPPPGHDTYLSFMVYLRAIQNGLGIGIGWRPLIDEFLANGTLALACDHEHDSKRGYFCSVTALGKTKTGAHLFQNWIAQAA